MKRRFDKYYGYWWVQLPNKTWKREHHYVWESAGNPPVRRGWVLHHKDENKENNALDNLELMTRSQHAKHHSKGRVVSEETREKMKAGARRRCADPEHRKHLSERAKAQHAAGKLGRATWTETSDPGKEVWSQVGRLQTDRLRKMAAQTSSEEMRRRSYQRKMFVEKEQSA
jgi:hypothetical protein